MRTGHELCALLLAVLLVVTWTGSALHLALEAHHVAQVAGPQPELHAGQAHAHAHDDVGHGHDDDVRAEHGAESHAPHDAADHLPPAFVSPEAGPSLPPAPPAAAGFVALPAPRPLRWVPRDQVPEPDSDPPLRPAPPRAPPVG